MIRIGTREVTDVRIGGKPVMRVCRYVGGTLRVIWERLRGFIFTKDGFSLSTKDNLIIKCKDQ